jgi:hypothetical protein
MLLAVHGICALSKICELFLAVNPFPDVGGHSGVGADQQRAFHLGVFRHNADDAAAH